MTDLTEQWKKGELPAGCYYIEDAGIYRTVYKSERDDVLEYEHNVYITEMDDCTIIAPVPSYSEYLTLQSDSLAKNEAVEINAELEAENAKLKEEYEAECHRSDELEDSFWKEHKENAQLKELLKDARNVLKMVDTYYGDYDSTKGFLIVERIDEVLK